MPSLNRDFFAQEIDKAFSVIPERFRNACRNLAVIIEDGSEDGLLGLYEGVPLSEYAGDPTGMLPCTLTLYMKDINEEAEASGDGVALVIRETLWHEFAHALGFDEDGAERLERKWEAAWQERYGERDPSTSSG